ncbi:MAG TPA: LysM domain-containing protein [Candidatus Methylacidiphilales bacterium]|jgi:LysM repeat protein|nr:LysM domain-containing protein [Candidatus Methylacidiphilales bacterium]
MTTRPSSSFILCTLAFAFAIAPAFLSQAQTNAPADASSNAVPTAPAATPAPAAAPADTNVAPATALAPEERPSTYTIVQGDSLWKIAHQFGTTVVKLRKLNHLQKGALLHPGQVLQIPPATSDTTTK